MSFPQSGIGQMLLLSKGILELLGLMQSMCLVSFSISNISDLTDN